MRIKYLIFITLLFALINLNNSTSYLSENPLNNDCLRINNLSEEDINVEISDINVVSDNITLNKKYDKYAIITMQISNISLNSIELSNINYYAYQNNIKLQTFLKSENNECLGFVGKLESGESKKIKICVALEDEKQPIELVFHNRAEFK